MKFKHPSIFICYLLELNTEFLQIFYRNIWQLENPIKNTFFCLCFEKIHQSAGKITPPRVGSQCGGILKIKGLRHSHYKSRPSILEMFPMENPVINLNISRSHSNTSGRDTTLISRPKITLAPKL